MVKFVDECVGCPSEMGCIGSACPYMHVPVFICDECGDEVEDLYKTGAGDLCIDCAKKELDDCDLAETVERVFDRMDIDSYCAEYDEE